MPLRSLLYSCWIIFATLINKDLCPFVQVIRKRIIEEGLRVDGRQLDEVRPVYCESNTYPVLHGSALFSRGDTQVLSLSPPSLPLPTYLPLSLNQMIEHIYTVLFP